MTPEQFTTLERRLESGTQAILKSLAPTEYTGNPLARRAQVALNTVRQFAVGALRASFPGRRRPVRPQASVRAHYEKRWSSLASVGPPLTEKIVEYGPRLLVVTKEPFVSWFYVMAIAELIHTVGARRVLEVGSGMGFNVNALSWLCPQTMFVGLELTEAGPSRARQISVDPMFASEVAAVYAGVGLSREQQRQRPPAFLRGNATQLPFPAETFDLVISVLALEQMNPVVAHVLPEIARVARGTIAHVEPFADFNGSLFRRLHLQNKNYFRDDSRALKRVGFTPVFSWNGFPRKLQFTAGLVVAERHNR